MWQNADSPFLSFAVLHSLLPFNSSNLRFVCNGYTSVVDDGLGGVDLSFLSTIAYCLLSRGMEIWGNSLFLIDRSMNSSNSSGKTSARHFVPANMTNRSAKPSSLPNRRRHKKYCYKSRSEQTMFTNDKPVRVSSFLNAPSFFFG
jgi:hypothetical protein